MSGYIRLSRKFFNNSYWTAERTYSLAEAWLDLIQSARFEAEPTTIYLPSGRCIEIKRGELRASLRFLSERWGWGKNCEKARKFIDRCIENKEIERRALHGESILKLCNYDIYNPIIYEAVTPTVTLPVTPVVTPTVTKNNKEKKDNKENNNKAISSNEDNAMSSCESSSTRIDYKALIDFFNKKTKGVFGEVKYPISDKRRNSIKARIREHGKDSFILAIEKASKSDFLKGGSKSGFKASLDWLIRPDNFQKAIEGNYDNRGATHAGGLITHNEMCAIINKENISTDYFERQEIDGKILWRRK